MINNEKRTSSFYLTKWYADLIDDQSDDLIIIYVGEMKWNFLHIPFTNVLRFLARHQLISDASFSALTLPELHNTSVILNTEHISARWTSNSSRIYERLYECTDGYIDWECLMPLAHGQITIENDHHRYQGFGYVERLTLTLKPWQLPMDQLRWGRFVSVDQSIVWIQWHGKEEKCFIFYNGTKYLEGLISDDELQFANYRLILSKKSTLRDGPVSETVFHRYNWIQRLFPSNFLSHLIECKWQTWSELYEDDHVNVKNGQQHHLLAQGWSIHENVNLKSRWNLLGKIAYGSLFIIFLPLLLIIWAHRTENAIHLPIPHYPLIGLILACFGFFLMAFAMMELWFEGDGLPMNAYPPPKFVNTGVYYFFAHPIYIGASLMSFGFAMYAESSSGFWFISPFLTIAWLALVYGYENENLQQRFPHITYRPLFHLPEATVEFADMSDRISAYCLVLLPWLLLYETVIFIDIPRHPLSTYLPFEKSTQVIEWTALFYVLAYPYVILLPCLLKTKEQLRTFMINGWINVAIGIYCQLIFPFIAKPKPFQPTTFFGHLLSLERQFDGANGALPSFHVSWAFLTAFHYTCRFPRFKNIFYVFSILVSISCMTTGMHSLMDVLTGWLLFIVCIQRQSLLFHLRFRYEYLANAWTFYRLGPMRILNHSFWTMPVGFMGYFLLCSLLGNSLIVLFVSLSSLLGAALWGQWIEHSSGLSRPFGYFGCIMGGALASIIASYLFNISLVCILSAFALISPWIQASGRLRCIIQGCCHGRITSNPSIGIVVTNIKSRVCALSKLNNVPIHPTAAYSIFANIIIGLFLWRLWYSEVALNIIMSVYLILIGLSRFVEETFRGEVQTPIYGQLKIYQWMSIIFVLVGIFTSMIPIDRTIYLTFHPRFMDLIPSILYGFGAAFLMSVDFPESKRRFSRLAD